MYISLLIFFFICALIGVTFNFLLFRQEKKHIKQQKFITSERLLVFAIEILIAVIGFGVTLSITNYNERQIEKEKAIRIIEQTIEYTDYQIERDKAYLSMYKKDEIDSEKFINSSVINLNYFENILSNELILQNTNMFGYGEIMKYLVWLENADEKAKQATDDEKLYAQMYWRYAYLIKINESLSICLDEMTGEITTEEAKEKLDETKYMTLAEIVKAKENGSLD